MNVLELVRMNIGIVSFASDEEGRRRRNRERHDFHLAIREKEGTETGGGN